MNQEKFVNQYIELLNATVAEAIQKNIVLQAQKRMAEFEIEECREEIKNYKEIIAVLKSEKENETMLLRAQLNDALMQATHLETFKNELIKLRAENKQLVVKPSEEKTTSKDAKDTGNTWTKKAPVKKKSLAKEEIIKDAGKF